MTKGSVSASRSSGRLYSASALSGWRCRDDPTAPAERHFSRAEMDNGHSLRRS